MAGSLTTRQQTSSRTLAAALERDRLEHRLRRVGVAIAALRGRAGEHQDELGAPPKPIQEAIAYFEARMAAINERLQELSRDRSSTRSGTERIG